MRTARQSDLEAAVAAMMARRPAPPKPAPTTGLLYGAQAQVDRVMADVPARKVALTVTLQDGSQAFAGWAYEFGGAVSAQAPAAVKMVA